MLQGTKSKPVYKAIPYPCIEPIEGFKATTQVSSELQLFILDFIPSIALTALQDA